jgi:hypothetical protein
MDTRVCSNQMDLLVTLNACSIWRLAASRWRDDLPILTYTRR